MHPLKRKCLKLTHPLQITVYSKISTQYFAVWM